VIALVGVWLVISAGNGSNDDKAADTASSATRAEPSTTTKSAREGATAQASTTAASDLGSFPSRAALTAALQAADVTTLGAGTGSTNDSAQAPALPIDRCEATVDAGQPELGDRLAVATARLDGRPIYVFSHPVRGKNPPVTQLTVVDQQTCNVLFAIQR